MEGETPKEKENFHNYLLENGYEEIEAFFGRGSIHLMSYGLVGKMCDALNLLDIDKGSIEGVVVLPIDMVPDSRANKEGVKFAIYAPKERDYGQRGTNSS